MSPSDHSLNRVLDHPSTTAPQNRTSDVHTNGHLTGTTPFNEAVKLGRKVSEWLNTKLPFSLTLKIVALVFALSWYALVPVRLTSINDPDLGWQLRSGEWIVQHHQLPRTDPFSITGAGSRWVAYSWSYSLLIYEVAKNFDLLGVAAYTLLAWMAIVIALFVLVRGQGASFWRAILLTIAAGFILERIVSPRAGTITMLLFIVLFHLLLQERKRGYTRRIWVAPVLIWIWANVHVQFLYGLFIIGLFCIEPVLDWLFLGHELRNSISPRLWAVLGVSTAITFLNPYGFGPYEVILNFLRQPLLTIYVQETNAMPFTVLMNYFVLFLTLGAAFVLGRRRGIRPLWVILLTWSAYSAFKMEREIWLVTTIALAIIAARGEPADKPHENPRVWLYGSVGVLVVTFAMLMRVPSNRQLLSMLSTEMPVGAVAYIHEHHLPGPIFNDYDWGGFLIYALPKHPVAIDGRTNVHGQDEVGRSLNTWALHPGWDKDPLLQGANLVIGSPRRPLTNYLMRDPHFKVLFDDGVCVLLERVSPGTLPLQEAPARQTNSPTAEQRNPRGSISEYGEPRTSTGERDHDPVS